MTWAAFGLLLGTLVILGRGRLRRLSPGWLAVQLEELGFRRGALSGHLEPAAAGTSAGLLELADDHQAAELEARAPPFLARLRTPFRRHALQGGASLLAGGLILLSANPTRGRAALLWRPGEAWDATVAPLTITASAREVERGALVQISALARGRQHAILWVRAPGESWRGQGLTLDSAGRATTTLGPVQSDLYVRLQSGGRNSDTLQVKVRLPAFLGTLTVLARYPRYLGLEDEPVPTQGDTVVVPEGTRLETRGEATAALTEAAWTGAGDRASLSVEGTRFQGTFTPRGWRLWTLQLVTATGQALAGDTVRLSILTVPDSAPRVDVPVPGADTVVPLTLKVPLVVDAQDDHGLTRVLVESRRISRLGLISIDADCCRGTRSVSPYG
jgi:hypothetical protein